MTILEANPDDAQEHAQLVNSAGDSSKQGWTTKADGSFSSRSQNQ